MLIRLYYIAIGVYEPGHARVVLPFFFEHFLLRLYIAVVEDKLYHYVVISKHRKGMGIATLTDVYLMQNEY